MFNKIVPCLTICSCVWFGWVERKMEKFSFDTLQKPKCIFIKMNNKTKSHALDNGVHENLLKSKSSWVCRTIYWTSFGYLPDLCLRVLLFIAHIHINYILFFWKTFYFSFFSFTLFPCAWARPTHIALKPRHLASFTF